MATATKLTGTYTADPVHSSFAFAVRYQGVSLFKGTLDEVDAKLVDGKLEGSAKVESISIRTPEQFRAHVLSAEFFDAANHPTVDELRSAVTAAARDGTEKLLLDLTRVEFIDSSGLGGLLELRSTLRAGNVTLEILAGEGPVRQAMEITGLSELLAR